MESAVGRPVRTYSGNNIYLHACRGEAKFIAFFLKFLRRKDGTKEEGGRLVEGLI